MFVCASCLVCLRRERDKSNCFLLLLPRSLSPQQPAALLLALHTEAGEVRKEGRKSRKRKVLILSKLVVVTVPRLQPRGRRQKFHTAIICGAPPPLFFILSQKPRPQFLPFSSHLQKLAGFARLSAKRFFTLSSSHFHSFGLLLPLLIWSALCGCARRERDCHCSGSKSYGRIPLRCLRAWGAS